MQAEAPSVPSTAPTSIVKSLKRLGKLLKDGENVISEYEVRQLVYKSPSTGNSTGRAEDEARRSSGE